MRRLVEALRRTRSGRAELVAALARFPVSFAALAALAVVANLDVAGALDLTAERLQWLLVGLADAAAVAAAVAIFGEAGGLPALPRQAAAAVAAAAAGIAVALWRDLSVAGWALTASVLLAFPLAPYARRSAGFWSFAWRLAGAAFLATLAAIVFVGGFFAVLASLEYLFSVPIAESLYGHVWVTGLGLVGPVFGLSRLPADYPGDDAADRRDPIAGGLIGLSDFVAAPLLAVYAAVLHAYALKVVVTGVVPDNEIGWLVLFYALSVLALRLAVEPLGAAARLPTRLFRRWWPALLVVPLILLAAAVRLRIDAYGLTPQRYGLALFSACLALLVLAQAVPRLRGDIRLIPGLGALFLCLASFGPWGMISASAADQAARLRDRLAAAGALHDGVLAAAPALDLKTSLEIQSQLQLLDALGRLDDLRPLFVGRADDPFRTASPQTQPWQRVAAALGADPRVAGAAVDGAFWVEHGRPEPLRLDSYDLVVPWFEWTVGPPLELVVGGVALRLAISEEDTLVIESSGRRLALTPQRLGRSLDTRIVAQPGTAAPPLFLEFEIDGARLAVLFDTVSGRAGAGGVDIGGARVILFLRMRDWNDARPGG